MKIKPLLMKLVLSKKTYTPLFILAILGSLFAQQKSVQNELISPDIYVHPEEKDLILEHLLATRDTSSLFYYSFERQQAIKFKEYVNDASFSFITSCIGGNLILSAPDYGSEANYSWSGPNNFKSSSSEINIANIRMSDDGIYSVVVTNGDLTVYGNIKLLVKDKPSFSINNTEFEEGQVIHILATDPDGSINYIWKNSKNQIISKSSELWLAEQSPGEYTYFLSAEKNGCKISQPVLISINSRSKVGSNKSLIEKIRNPG